MTVDLTFDEYGLLLRAVNNLKMQQKGAPEIAAFEHLLEKLFQACHTVPVPPDNRDETTFIQHQAWNTGNYRFVEPSQWAAAIGASETSETPARVKPPVGRIPE
jgi:hypothetical protein